MRKLFEVKERNPDLLATYYWGNVPAVNLLDLAMNAEGEEYSDPLTLMLCEVGDPRNVLLTISPLPSVYQKQEVPGLEQSCFYCTNVCFIH